MDSKKLNDWLQVAGLFGVLGGLIFVGLQLRLDRQVALAESQHWFADETKQWAEIVNDNADVWVKGLAGEPLSEEESARFDALAAAHERRYFSAWASAQQLPGLPPELHAFDLAAEIHRHPGLMRWWLEERARTAISRQTAGLSESTSWGALVNDSLSRLEEEENQ